MNRREFLKSMGVGIALCAVPSSLLSKGLQWGDKTTKVKLQINSDMIAMSLDDFSKEVIKPVIERLAKQVDDYVFQKVMENK